jgi:hypothetical protein
MGYLDDIAHEPPDIVKFKDYAFVGSYVHTSIEAWFEEYMTNDHNIPNLVDPKTHFVNTMNQIYLKKSASITDPADDEIIVNCLNNFIDFMDRRLRYVKDIKMPEAFLPVYIEKEYNKEINGVPFHGYVDAIFFDRKIWPFDWKTSKDAHISEGYKKQGIRYLILMEEEFGERLRKMGKGLNEFFVINLRKKVDIDASRIVVFDEMKNARAPAPPRSRASPAARPAAPRPAARRCAGWSASCR